MTDEANNTDPNANTAPTTETPPASATQAAPAEASTATPDPTEVIAALTAERDRYKDQALRALADLDNYRKRARRDADEAVKKAREDQLRELLPVFDNLERATRYFDASADMSAVAKGVEMVLRLFEDTLGRLGGKRVPTVGKPFDPSVHEAIQQVESAEHPAGTVAREEVAGYILGERLLRPAMVVVSKGSPSGSPSGSPDAGGGGAAGTA